MITAVSKGWRVFATGFCFSLFGLGALLLTFLVFPLMTFTAKDHQDRAKRVQRIIQKTFLLFCLIMKYTGAINFRITGAEKLKEDRSCLILANHPSLIDYVLIASQLPQCDCLVKSAIWHNPFMKGIVKAAGYIPNNSPDDLFSRCGERLGDGNVLLIFPEGTRTTPNERSVLQRGASQIAVRTQTDIRIVHITVTPSFLTKEKKWYQVPDTRPFFHVQVKGKIVASEFTDCDVAEATLARRLNKTLASALFPNTDNSKHQHST
ncbi:lysophospholipid acyltransferase family protein [Enterovibrio norvegicus]|uniref:Lysophospholipid acyltransferase family protein n=1 Tax=Enterovibrio norvegicus TaxID=188144 RepID=A0ABV4L5U7_9GAMM|nr:lysophospholipid acyltransferase family protein [Enterovibrio norvegicus]OEF57284.1 acyl-phosphate glycerol 3-phosphate acyltransferase [Enterovibrio norvegicus]